MSPIIERLALEAGFGGYVQPGHLERFATLLAEHLATHVEQLPLGTYMGAKAVRQRDATVAAVAEAIRAVFPGGGA